MCVMVPHGDPLSPPLGFGVTVRSVLTPPPQTAHNQFCNWQTPPLPKTVFSTLPSPCPAPPKGRQPPPVPGGDGHQVTVPPLGGGGPYTTPELPILV